VAKVTSKLQVTLPKALARRYEIKPGDDILWVAAGDSIRVVRASRDRSATTRAAKLGWFDRATARQRAREAENATSPASDRGWKREDLYPRGRGR
jgi:bifunctional DNA-binding transcriptional regulator/antitoxin component of YhaV-PrlF toxin-antitoxin module